MSLEYIDSREYVIIERKRIIFLLKGVEVCTKLVLTIVKNVIYYNIISVISFNWLVLKFLLKF